MAKYIIFGASSGIGRATAERLASQGNSLILASSNRDRLENARYSLVNPDSHRIAVFDARSPETLPGVFDIAVSDGSMIDGMVYTVGVASASPLRGLLAKTIEDILRVNFTSFILAVSLFTKKKYSHGGSVVALSAANAHYPQKCMSVYAASKAAIEAAVQSMAIELRDLNIRINAVIPGATDTPMTDSLDDAVVESIVKRQLLGIIDPRDIASAVCFLLSEDSKAITGRSMYVDGGMLGQ